MTLSHHFQVLGMVQVCLQIWKVLDFLITFGISHQSVNGDARYRLSHQQCKIRVLIEMCTVGQARIPSDAHH